jgi:hypothetical protein
MGGAGAVEPHFFQKHPLSDPMSAPKVARVRLPEGIYEGEVNDADRPHGNGTLTFLEDGVAIEVMRGSFVNGLAHGFVVAECTNGTRYEGETVRGHRTGYCVRTWALGRYEGMVIDDVYNGMGKVTFASGETLEGNFKNGKVNGFGRWFVGGAKHKGDNKTYVGEMVDDRFHGFGVLTHTCGRRYEGFFVKNERHGEITTTFEDRAMTGTWDRDDRHGTFISTEDGQMVTYREEWVRSELQSRVRIPFIPARLFRTFPTKAAHEAFLMGAIRERLVARGPPTHLCQICIDAPVEFVNLPCGHAVCCAKCIRSLMTCPVCRGALQRTVAILRH